MDYNSKLQTFGYQIEKQLGQGASGVVYKTKKDGHIYAIKVLISQMGGNKSYLQQELEISYNLQKIQETTPTDYVTKIFQIHKDNQFSFIVSEFCDQGDLYNFYKQNYQYFGILTIATIFKQIMNGIDYIHKAGIIHRDLKPENILVKEQDSVYLLKITDFGISSEGDLLKSQVGTVNYMAPEIILNKNYGKEVDIWAFGCIAYEIITQQQLFSAENQFKVAQQIVQFQKFEHKHFNYYELYDIIEKCLKINPHERPSSKEILQELKKIIDKNTIYERISEIKDNSKEEDQEEEKEEEQSDSSSEDLIRSQQQSNLDIENIGNKQYKEIARNKTSNHFLIICNEKEAQQFQNKSIISRESEVKENNLAQIRQYYSTLDEKLLKKGTSRYILYKHLNDFLESLNLQQQEKEMLNYCLINCYLAEKDFNSKFKYLIQDLLRKEALQQTILKICEKKSEQIKQQYKEDNKISFEKFKDDLIKYIPTSKTRQFFSFLYSQKQWFCFGFLFVLGSSILYYEYLYKSKYQK